MRRVALGALCAMTAFAVVSPAFAQTSVDRVVSELRRSHVYIEPGTPGTTRTTASTIAARISPADPVVIVMVPPSSTIDPDDLAQQIDDATAHKYIVGVSVGSKTAGTASILPAGAASDQMHRAATVATNPPEIMTTFVTNIHDYLKLHPLPKPGAPPSKPEASTEGHTTLKVLVLLLGLPGVAIALSIVSLKNRRRREPQDTLRPVLPDPPGPIKDLLRQVEKRAGHILDVSSRKTLLSACDETKVMFSRLENETWSQPYRLTIEAFQTHLTNLLAVLDTYLDIQDHPSYWDEPSGLLADGQESIASYAADVLETIKSINRKTAFDFQVKTSILNANRLKK